MSKSIRSYPEWERKNVIARRIKQNAGGLGTLAAKDALAKVGEVKEEKKEEEQKVMPSQLNWLKQMSLKHESEGSIPSEGTGEKCGFDFYHP